MTVAEAHGIRAACRKMKGGRGLSKWGRRDGKPSLRDLDIEAAGVLRESRRERAKRVMPGATGMAPKVRAVVGGAGRFMRGLFGRR